jgi:hypothetical protein
VHYDLKVPFFYYHGTSAQYKHNQCVFVIPPRKVFSIGALRLLPEGQDQDPPTLLFNATAELEISYIVLSFAPDLILDAQKMGLSRYSSKQKFFGCFWSA